jgi:hypothetical protein
VVPAGRMRSNDAMAAERSMPKSRVAPLIGVMVPSGNDWLAGN